MTTSESNRYWFPAKKFGWGWGMPNNWQGWATYLAYTALLISGIALVGPAHNPIGFALYVAAISGALLGICLVKGERPSWRWGKSDA
jgi:hypothetical protein